MKIIILLAVILSAFSCTNKVEKNLENVISVKMDTLEVIGSGNSLRANLRFINSGEDEVSLWLSSSKYRESAEWLLFRDGKYYTSKNIEPHPININSKGEILVVAEFRLSEGSPNEIPSNNQFVFRFLSITKNGKRYENSFELDLMLQKP